MRTKFARANYFPAGWEIDLSRFLSLFHRYGYIYRPLSSGTWASANDRWALTDTEIIKAISLAHDKFLLGARAGKTSRFAVLDIDAGSRYHNRKHLGRLLQILEQSGLSKSSLFRSSTSEGWHLYLFFDEPINSSELHQHLVALLRVNDFVVSKGTLEVFPNPGRNSQGMGLRLPLQHGFAWLDKRTLDVDHYREQMTATKALTYFLDLLDADANPYKAFRDLKGHIHDLSTKREKAKLPSALPSNVVPLRDSIPMPDNAGGQLVATIFGHLPSGMNAENWCRGRQFSIEGLTGPSQRAEAIFSLNHYLFYGDPSRNLLAMGYGFEEERDWAVKEFLESRHGGHSSDISRGRADALEQSTRAAHWRPPSKRYTDQKTYTATVPISWVRENQNRKTDARKRIQGALDALKKLGAFFHDRGASRCRRVRPRYPVQAFRHLPAQEAFQKALYDKFHQLTAAELKSLNEVVQPMANPAAFKLESSATNYLCDRRALSLSGQWIGTMEQDLSFIVDLHGDGKWTQKIYYVAAPNDFEAYNAEANGILESIVWIRAGATKS